MARSTQTKFEAKMDALAERFGVEAIIDHGYANVGSVTFQDEDSFDPILRFGFDHQSGYSSFSGTEIGKNPNGGAWSYVEHAGPADSRRSQLAGFVEHVADLLAEKLT